MAIESPIKPVYYYECSYGKFRLVYFIPPNELLQLIDENKISAQVLEDFPDGVDLDCTEPDFVEFHDQYKYRPEITPDALRRAFFAIFSTTYEWESFRGSGFIPAADLERQVEPIEENLKAEKITLEEIQPLPDQPSIEERRQFFKQRAEQQSLEQNYLTNIKVEGIDPQKSLSQQKFSSIKKQKGERMEDVFSRLLLKGKG
jgi:hypothetical protein